MENVVLYGAGYVGKKCYQNPCRRFKIVAVLDRNETLYGTEFAPDVPIIEIDEYIAKYRACNIVITSYKYEEIIKQLKSLHIYNYRVAADLDDSEDVCIGRDICHENWISYLQEKFNKEGMEILEIGARNVAGARLSDYFSRANYIGFDYYPGENVHVVGDAHELSRYFDKKFDLIFSSAVFEHLAMPWKVSTEIIKLLKVNGYIFIETHYSFSSHERLWHFFQFSENALDVLFPEKFGMQCLKKGCCNLLEGKFSEYASEYLAGRRVHGLYCHSAYLEKKVKEAENLSWDDISLLDVVKSTRYPKPKME